MGKIVKIFVGLLAATALASAPVQASPVFDNFGPFAEATFGGSGIPNDSVAASSQFIADYSTDAGQQRALVTIAMNATQRFSNTPVTNDSFGTFFAEAGADSGGSSTSTWNFNYFIKVESVTGSTPELEDFKIDIFYDFDPAVDTPTSELGQISVNGATAGSGLTLVQDSQNLTFGFLAPPAVPNITPPSSVTAFDRDALGEYSFRIEIKNLVTEETYETVAIDVVTTPEPGSLILAGLGSLAMLSRRRR